VRGADVNAKIVEWESSSPQNPYWVGYPFAGGAEEVEALVAERDSTRHLRGIADMAARSGGRFPALTGCLSRCLRCCRAAGRAAGEAVDAGRRGDPRAGREQDGTRWRLRSRHRAPAFPS